MPKGSYSYIKWIGGKGRVLKYIKERLPGDFDSYFEPFLGSASVFFNLQPENSFLSDVNEELILTHKTIRDDVDGVIKHLRTFENTKEFYLQIRSWDREDTFKTRLAAQRAARFIFMNKTGFNGMCRYNSNGHFNIPYGGYKNPKFCEVEDLKRFSGLLKKSRDIKVQSFEEILRDVRAGDFVYLDPPYDETFNGYSNIDFDRSFQDSLVDVCGYLDELGVKFMLSNLATDYILNKYDRYNINSINVTHTAGSTGERRKVRTEVLVMNYDTSVYRTRGFFYKN